MFIRVSLYYTNERSIRTREETQFHRYFMKPVLLFIYLKGDMTINNVPNTPSHICSIEQGKDTLYKLIHMILGLLLFNTKNTFKFT